jgi:hypothetical protein
VHGVAVDAELGRERLDPATGCVRSDEFGDALGVETLLGLLRSTLGPPRSRCPWQIEEGSEAFYVVRGVE